MDASKLPPYAIVVLVPFLWFAICQLLGFLSGWRRLGEQYPHSGQVPGGVMDFASATMGVVAYHGLVVAATPSGLYLSPQRLLSPGHPRVLVPWSDVHAEPGGRWMKHVELRFARAPSVRFRLAGEHPEILRLATGRPGA